MSIEKKRIFVGGTGRSGTTILSRLLATHHSIKKLPLETRFLIDNRGLINLFNSLTCNYSFDQGRMGIRQFSELMLRDLPNPHTTPYLGFVFRRFNSPLVRDRTMALLNSLSKGSFIGKDYNSQDRYKIWSKIRWLLSPFGYLVLKISKLIFGQPKFLGLYGYTNVKPAEKIFIPKYFKEENALIDRLRHYTDDLFSILIKDTESGWCEDTPANIYNIEFLFKLFPEAYYVHVMRHPVGTAYSMKNMPWAPNTYDQICDMLEELFERAINSHELALNNKRLNYVFVKLEDLESDEYLRLFLKKLELDFSELTNEVKIDSQLMNQYRERMSSEDFHYVSKRLEKYVVFFGYD